MPGMNKTQRLRHERGIGVAKAYEAWVNMRRRTRNADPKRKEGCYKGINVCESWNDFEAFLIDMGEPKENESIDRIDSLGDYEKNNCRWANATIQSRNRKSVKLDFDIVSKIRDLYNTTKLTQKELGEMFNISQFMVSCIVRNKNWIF